MTTHQRAGLREVWLFCRIFALIAGVCAAFLALAWLLTRLTGSMLAGFLLAGVLVVLAEGYWVYRYGVRQSKKSSN